MTTPTLSSPGSRAADAICPLCGSRNIRERWHRLHVVYHRCVDCSLIFQWPFPTPEELAKLYTEDYYHKDPGSSALIGYADYELDADRELAREILQPVGHPPRAGARLLDIGCATGVTLSMARELGWDPHGIEISPWAAGHARAKGITVHERPLRECGFPDASFDAVTLFQVIEHFRDPLAELREVRRILRPGGILVMETPNIESFTVRFVYGPRSVLVQPDAHLVLFSRKTMQRALEATGFAPVSMATQPHGRTYRRVFGTFFRRAVKKPFAAIGYRIGPLSLRGMFKRPDDTELPQITINDNLQVVARTA